MLHFAHNCLIKGLCKVEDARKIGIPHYISDKLNTKFQEEWRCNEQANMNWRCWPKSVTKAQRALCKFRLCLTCQLIWSVDSHFSTFYFLHLMLMLVIACHCQGPNELNPHLQNQRHRRPSQLRSVMIWYHHPFLSQTTTVTTSLISGSHHLWLV